ncbi:Arc family DNA-binding protein [Acinetobacter variabilis]|uniref:Arc family DNA-binding protein n=1 Tax=Acinetobacter variabilis TaxID=70346 RepID=UPI0021BE7850|nr:Arc family DNA-binding protein [Acinetobacter variabilis]UXI52690.1 Arc family DNA-binding protein [Acinetobacter variabilis]
MSNQTDHTIVRLRVPPELKQKIEDSAEKNNRSQSAEMVARLEQSFSAPETTQSLLEEAVMLTLKAVKDDPSLLNNPKVSTKYVADNNAEKDTVEFINKNKAP